MNLHLRRSKLQSKVSFLEKIRGFLWVSAACTLVTYLFTLLVCVVVGRLCGAFLHSGKVQQCRCGAEEKNCSVSHRAISQLSSTQTSRGQRSIWTSNTSLGGFCVCVGGFCVCVRLCMHIIMCKNEATEG